jgi:hypothetical protein
MGTLNMPAHTLRERLNGQEESCKEEGCHEEEGANSQGHPQEEEGRKEEGIETQAATKEEEHRKEEGRREEVWGNKAGPCPEAAEAPEARDGSVDGRAAARHLDL